MTLRAAPTHALRALAHQLSAEPPGRLYAITGTDRRPNATPELFVDDPEDLIGFVADPSWRGIALVLGGRARDIGADDAVAAHRQVTLGFVLDRRGRCAVAIRDGVVVDEVDGLRGVSGFVADVALRILGLPTEPEPCGTAAVFVSVWLRNVLDCVADPELSGEVRSWSDVVALHPAFTPSSGLVDGAPLPDCDPHELAGITVDVARQLSWRRLHRLAADTTIHIPGLSPHAAAWMDWPFFARWTLDVHRPAADLLDDLSLFVDGALLGDIRRTVGAVGAVGCD